MLIPRLLYGSGREVRAGVRPLVRQLIGGVQIASLEFGDLMSTQEDSGAMLLLHGGRGLDNGPRHFHVDALFSELNESALRRQPDTHAVEKCFSWSLEEPWKFLGVAGQSGGAFLFPTAMSIWRRPFLEAALRHLDVLEAEGPRYGHSQMFARTFSQSPTSILPQLAKVGVSLVGDLGTMSVSRLKHMINLALARLNTQTT